MKNIRYLINFLLELWSVQEHLSLMSLQCKYIFICEFSKKVFLHYELINLYRILLHPLKMPSKWNCITALSQFNPQSVQLKSPFRK